MDLPPASSKSSSAKASRPGLALPFAAAAAALSVPVLLRYRKDLRAARARVSHGSTIAHTSLGPIEYAALGDGAPILVVHGAGGGFDQGIEIGRDLVPAGFRLIAMSRFGYLRTPLPDDASAAAQADAHAALLDALQIERAAVLGVSAGACSSTQLAIRHPDRCSALVLLVPAIHVPRPEGAASIVTPAGTRLLFGTALRSDFLYWSAIKLAPETLMRAILATPPDVVAEAGPAERERVLRVMELALPVSRRRLGLLNDAEVVSTLARYPLERITSPTLAVSLSDDLFGTFDAARYTAGQVPRGRFLGFERGGHIWVGHHEEVMRAIADFVRIERV
jgi:pimeloyl-ACP methyl ester carboxylesterase